MKRRYPLLLTLLLSTGAAQAANLDILACATQEKQAVTPTDALNCEWKNGLFDATLAQLYGEGWRLIEVAFFDGTREVLYLERPVVAAATPTAPTFAPEAEAVAP